MSFGILKNSLSSLESFSCHKLIKVFFLCVWGGKATKQTQPECPGKTEYVRSLLMCFQSARTSSLFLISFYQSDLYMYIKYTLHSVFISTQSLLLCSLKAPHVWICNFDKCVHVPVICVYDYGAVSDSRPLRRAPRSPKNPPGAFPDGLQNSYSSQKRHRCQSRRSLAGRTRPGTWHITIPQDKGATFGGHLRVLGPAVLSPSWALSKIWIISRFLTEWYLKNLSYILQQ